MYYMLLHLYFETADFVLELPTYFSSNGIIRSAELWQDCLENYIILMCQTFS